MKIHKRIIFFVFCLGTLNIYGQDIVLPEPKLDSTVTLFEALNKRESVRDFLDKELSNENLSELLWAAFGVNRKDKGMRTAPSAHNAQEINIYVALKTGVYIYDAFSNKLVKHIDEDIRKYCGKQGFVKDASAVLIYVADISKKGINEYIEVDTGFISQNVYLYSAAKGLNTVILGWVDRDKLSKKLNLSENLKITYTQPVGHSSEN